MRLIKAKYIIPIDKAPLQNGCLVIDDDKIVSVDTYESKFSGLPTTDYGNAVIIPGLVDCHSHLDFTSVAAGRSLTLMHWVNDLVGKWLKLTVNQKIKSAVAGAKSLLQSGVTCVADTTYEGYSISALNQCGMKGIVFVEIFGFRDSCFQDAVIKKNEWEKIINNNLLRLSLAPHTTYTTSGKLIKKSAELMDQVNLPINIHVSETGEESALFKNGETKPFLDLAEFKESGFSWHIKNTTPIKFLHNLDLPDSSILTHCVSINDDDIKLIKQHRYSVVHCPRSNGLLGSGIAPVTKMIKAGVLVGLGTDSLASNTNLDFFEEMRSSLVIQRAFSRDLDYSSEVILKMATINGAKILNIPDIGALEPDKKADFVAINLENNDLDEQHPIYDRVVMGTKKEHVIEVFINGSSVYQNEKHSTL